MADPTPMTPSPSDRESSSFAPKTLTEEVMR